MTEITNIVNNSGSAPPDESAYAFVYGIAATYRAVHDTVGSVSAEEVWEWLESSAWNAGATLDEMFVSYSYVILAITVVWLLVPVSYILAMCGCCEADSSSMEVDTVTYEERMKFFTDCYDTQNPLTAKEGKLRFIAAELERYKDDPERQEELRKRQEAVRNASAAQAMQAYSMQAHARNMAY